MSAASALSPLDRAQWKLDKNFIRGAVMLSRCPDAGRLANRLRDMAAKEPRLLARFAPADPDETIDWSHCSAADLLESYELPDARSPTDLLHHLGLLRLSTSVANGRLWRWVLVRAPNCAAAPAALLICWHHAIADGRTGLSILQAIDAREISPSASLKPSAPWWSPLASAVGAAAWMATSTRSLLSASSQPDLAGTASVLTASRTFERGHIRRLSESWQCSQDTAILAIAARLYAAVERSHEQPDTPIRLIVPMTVQSSASTLPLGNHFFPAIITAPSRVRDAAALAKAIAAAVRSKVREMNAFGRAAFAGYLSFDDWISPRLPVAVYDRIRWGYLERLSGVCTLVPGPTRPFSIGGAPVLALHGVAPVLSGTSFSFTVLTYNARVTITLTGRPDCRIDLAGLLDNIDGLQ